MLRRSKRIYSFRSDQAGKLPRCKTTFIRRLDQHYGCSIACLHSNIILRSPEILTSLACLQDSTHLRWKKETSNYRMGRKGETREPGPPPCRHYHAHVHRFIATHWKTNTETEGKGKEMVNTQYIYIRNTKHGI